MELARGALARSQGKLDLNKCIIWMTKAINDAQVPATQIADVPVSPDTVRSWENSLVAMKIQRTLQDRVGGLDLHLCSLDELKAEASGTPAHRPCPDVCLRIANVMPPSAQLNQEVRESWHEFVQDLVDQSSQEPAAVLRDLPVGLTPLCAELWADARATGHASSIALPLDILVDMLEFRLIFKSELRCDSVEPFPYGRFTAARADQTWNVHIY
jgi:hypothetical protein